ncbi:MAG: TerB family tellurite resistance protein [Alphaproteobacteria bacterium]|nr:TerB family tellurite resistance protein [Alphaproteobacteria bacterium]
MSIWGKVGGAAAGFLIGGGPIGAALGALAGHAVFDREPGENEKQVAFTIGVTALAAKMARADGAATEQEFSAFKKIVHIEPGFEADVRRVYLMAHETVAGYEGYASQLGRLFRDKPGLLEDLLDALFFVASADGQLHDAELEYLREVARRFGLSDAAFNNLCASYGGPCEPDPYALLNIDASATNDEVRKAYLQAVRENHPDRMIARGAPEEFLAVATEKLARVNIAYDAIRKDRGL